MFEKYSISRDFLYSLILSIVVIIPSLFNINFLNFDTSNIINSMLDLSAVLFGFILTIITILFMFDPTNNPIFKKLQQDGLFNQIFKRFFDSLIVTGITVVFFLISSFYFKDTAFTLFNIIFYSSYILNVFIIIFIITLILRIYRCLFLLEKMYRVINSKIK